MVEIRVKKGLNIPIEGGATGSVVEESRAKEVALDFACFDDVKFRLLVDVGAEVQIGQPLAEDKDTPLRKFVSPGAGTVKEIRRGEKRRLLSIVISLSEKESFFEAAPFTLETASQESLTQYLLQHGFFAHIRQRPFNRLANPARPPRSIFVKALESAPFVPPAEMQLKGNEKAFERGLQALKKLTTGPVHLVHRKEDAFSHFEGVEHHTVSGPHPCSNPSVHIHFIDPIRKQGDVVWTVSALDVIQMGAFLLTGKQPLYRIVEVAGDSIRKEKRKFLRVRNGEGVATILQDRIDPLLPCRLISGDPLTGDKVEIDGHLGFAHATVTAIPEPVKREMLHFFRLGKDKFSASGAYLSGHLNPNKHKYFFSTSQHGEERAFIDGAVYQDYMPIPVLVMQLLRAIMSEDFELAEEHGLLEISHEDFALPEFVDPSKIPMMDIVRNGLRQYAKDILG